MRSPLEDAAMRLDVIAAKAKQLAEDLRNHRLWEGETSQGLQEIRDQLNKIKIPEGA
jgi:hypothetical protein